MKITVTEVGDPWKPNDAADPMWTIHIAGFGEPQRTYDPLLATKGEHEAEVFKAKNSGKEYWRTPKGSQPAQATQAQTTGGATPTKSYTADPKKLKQEFALEVAKNQSIQRQVALKACVELICYGKREYAELADTFHEAMGLLYPGYKKTDGEVPPAEDGETMVDQGDFAKTTHEADDDLTPPAELYDEEASSKPHA